MLHSQVLSASGTRRPGVLAGAQQRRRSSPAHAHAATPAAIEVAAPTRPRQRGSLRLFLDSADTAEWERYAPTGTLYGFTTNPLILDRDGVPCTLQSCKQLLLAARRLGARELQCQAWGGSVDALEASAFALLELDPEFITVKLPCTAEGLAAATAVLQADAQASITITGVYTQHQALLAQAIGADYCAPYLGRMADAALQELCKVQARERPGQPRPDLGLAQEACAEHAMSSIIGMQDAARAAGSSMRVLVASIRGAAQMAALATKGCDTFTFSPQVMQELVGVPLTLAAAADFEAAAARNQ